MKEKEYYQVEEIAELLGMTGRRVQQLAKEGIIPTLATKPKYKFDLYAVAQTYIKYLSDKIQGREAKTADSEQAEKEKLRAEADWKIAKAKMSEMQVSELEGTMHRAEDVEAVTNDLVYAVRSNVLSLPGRLAMDVVKCETAAEASALIREHCNNILEDLANYQYDPDEYRRRVRERQGWKEETVEEEPQQ